MPKTFYQNDDIQNNNNDFVVQCTIFAIYASSNSSDTVWFIRIKELCIVETSEDYGYAAVAGQSFITRNFPEKSRSKSNGDYFKVASKTSYFYHESILYPIAQFTEKENEFFIYNSEYFEIINFAEHTEMAFLPSLWIYIYYPSVRSFCWYIVLYSYYSYIYIFFMYFS